MRIKVTECGPPDLSDQPNKDAISQQEVEESLDFSITSLALASWLAGKILPPKYNMVTLGGSDVIMLGMSCSGALNFRQNSMVCE